MEIYLFILQEIERHYHKNCIFEHFLCLTNENALSYSRQER